MFTELVEQLEQVLYIFKIGKSGKAINLVT